MNIINLTPHTIDVYVGENKNAKLVIPSSGEIRVSEENSLAETLDNGLQLFTLSLKDQVDNLPEPQENTIYVVSLITLLSLKAMGINREDIYTVGVVIRDENGKPIGCHGLRKF